ncbi:MAG: crossover junction endodeoxyribonuclease RuvC [Calditrichaeota bacterium]|nr:crossover junction endodeoxyribonuclease RuvC [Calditrichota bacterium]MCB9391115.1 crossover junction endodeoxyribonuclease RuvC [Calditrichota bacterium]
MSPAGTSEIIIGIDPGLTCTGWGVISKQGSKLIYVDSGRLRTKPAEPMAVRLTYLFDQITSICEKHSVTRGAVEAGYVGTGAMSALKLGQARGCAVLAIQRATKQVMDVAPREVKMAVTGSGASSKQQVSYMVSQMLGIEFDRGEEDISDALAIAITATSIRNPKLLASRA